MANEPTSAEIVELKKKLDENPDSLVFAPLADAYRKQKKLSEALAVCKKGLEKHPHYASARVVLGRIYQDQDKVEEALGEFKKVLEGDPDNLMAHTLIGSVLMKKKDYQAAIEEYQKVLTLNPDDEDVQELLKQAIEKAAGENKAAAPVRSPERRVYERKTGSKESTASLTLAELYFKQGHYDKAVEMYQELLGSDPQNQILRQKLNDAIEKQAENAPAASKPPKKDAFTKPPDPKEDRLEGTAHPASAKGREKEEIKFTSEDILQVMQNGGKDDVMVEEHNPPAPAIAPKRDEVPASPPPPPAKPDPAPKAEIRSVPSDTAATVAKRDEVSASGPALKRGEASASGPALKRDEVSASGPAPMSGSRAEQIKGILAELSSTEGILGSLVTSAPGEPAVSVGDLRGDTKELGRLAAAIFENTQKSVDRLEQGRLQQVLITAETGHVILVDLPSGHLIVLADDRIKLGLLRLALDPAVKKLEKIA